MKSSAYGFAVLGLTLLLAFPASAASDSFKEGSVLEDGTNTAIAGAVVVVRWEDRTLGRSPTGCVRVEAAVTDAQGRYRVPAWQMPSAIPGQDLEPIVTVHKPGYQQTRLGKHRDTQYLKPSTFERKTRLDYLWRIHHFTECTAGDGRKNLLSFKRALHDEASEIAVTEQDKKIVDALRAAIEALAK